MAGVGRHVHVVEGLAGGLAASEPALASDIVFGAAALIATEDRFSRFVLDRWGAGRTSLRRPLPAAVGS